MYIYSLKPYRWNIVSWKANLGLRLMPWKAKFVVPGLCGKAWSPITSNQQTCCRARTSKRRITPISESDASARMLEKIYCDISTVMTVMCLVSLCYPSSSYLLFSMHVSLVSLACTVRSQPTAGSSFSSRSLKKIWRPCATRIQKKLIAS